ncbi:AAA family ATPase [Streptomyces sp. NPDC102441]|uniref:AAA family ATPase n=1 Tax=Streptomyces sp. NPDC102441 TaxID=3366176 RepID=UPI00380BFF79
MSPTAPAPDEQQLQNGQPRTFLDLKDTVTVATDTLMEIQDNVRDAIDARCMSVIYGDAGLGKTYGTEAALKQVDPQLLLTLEFTRSRPGPKDVREALFHQLHLPGVMPGEPTKMYRVLTEALPRRPYVIVCDEAQQYKRESFEYIRRLWDTGPEKTRATIIFVGGKEAYDTMQSDPALASRIHIRQEVLAMSEEEVLRTIPNFHPVWHGVDPEHLRTLDIRFTRGGFRNWVSVTAHAIKGKKLLKKETIDSELVEWILRKC